MSPRDDEVERLQRLRDRQLSARDPLVHNNQLQHKISQQYRDKKRYSFQDLLRVIPYKWWGIIIGAAIGLVIWVALSLLVDANWVSVVGIVATLVLPIVGFFFGQAFDLREELQDLARK